MVDSGDMMAARMIHFSAGFINFALIRASQNL
jgi:hypothetical protein